MGQYAAYQEVQKAVKSIDLGQNESSQVFAHSGDYNNAVTLNVVIFELTRNILLALLCVFICTLFLIGNIVSTVIVCLTVSVTLLDVAGKQIELQPSPPPDMLTP